MTPSADAEFDQVLITKLNTIEKSLERLEVRWEKVSDDHESRLRRLEAWSYALPVSLVLAVGSVGTSLFLAFRG